ncbi:MAG TPA: hypothetical protein VLM11_19115 [Streptosporangiaceae bacterium]|nr:hypothetical protein [Streptosporangiaceae bacterium]
MARVAKGLKVGGVVGAAVAAGDDVVDVGRSSLAADRFAVRVGG